MRVLSRIERCGATALARLAKRAAIATAPWQEALLLALLVAFTIRLTVLVTVALGRWRRSRCEVTTTPMTVYESSRGGSATVVHFYKGCEALKKVLSLQERRVCLHCARWHRESVDAVFEGAKRTA